MVADSITDSELFHGSPISRDFSNKKQKVNALRKLKHWKIDARRGQWIFQYVGKKANVVGEDGCRLKTLLDKFTDKEAWKIEHEEGSDAYDNDEIDLESILSVTSPTSVLKRKDSGNGDCFCCSKPMKEEDEEVYNDAYDNWDDFVDALNSFENDKDESSLKPEEDPNPNTSQSCKPETSPEKTTTHKNSRKKKKSGKQESDENSGCPICAGQMDATDLSFKPCPCGFKICLFCHKTISENDARCPGCRDEYKQTSDTSGQVSFQQRVHSPIRLSPSFRGLDRA